MCIATENYLSNLQFLHLSKKLQCIFAGRICWPGMDIAESFHLSRNKFNHHRALFALFQKKIYWKMPPPPYFWRKFYGGKFNFDDNWASHKVRTLLAYLSFSYVWNKYSVPIKMNISKGSINWLLMPKKDDQLLKH